MRSHKCVNKSLRGLRTEEFPNLANFIQSMKSFAAATAQQSGGFAFNAASTTGISFGIPATSSGQATGGGLGLGGAGKLFSRKVAVIRTAGSG